MSKPLDKTYISPSDNTSPIPALDPHWKEDIAFLAYQPLPEKLDGASVEQWCERCVAIRDDIEWLLELPHHKFWSQMVFDQSLQMCVDSYLTHGMRSFDLSCDLTAGQQELQKDLHRLFFLVCVRISTHKESKDHYISPSVFGNILYENFIFDIPKIMDMCSMYGACNQQLVTKMVENIFTQQPNYWEDLKAVVPTVLEVFDNILGQCGIRDPNGSPQKLAAPSINKNGIIALKELEDIVCYVGDTASTLMAYLDIQPAASQAFCDGGILLKLSSFYDTILPIMKDSINNADQTQKSLQVCLQQQLCQLRMTCVRLFHHIVANVYLNKILTSSEGESLEHCVEEYLHLITTLLSDKRFLVDYDRQYPIQDDLDLLRQSNYQIDDTRLDFISEAITSVYVAQNRKRQKKEDKKKKKEDQKVKEEELKKKEEFEREQAETAVRMKAGEARLAEAGGAAAAAVPSIDGVQLESLIYSVKDLLPDLGEGFIQICLEEYCYDVEKVINAVLEDRLPPSLADLDRTLKRDETALESSTSEMVATRQSVYDNDDFDIFNKPAIDMTRIHKGKKNINTDMKAILEDKSIVDHFRPVYDQYGHMDVKSIYDKERPNAAMYDEDYEDEYDDTYDDNKIGANDDDSADELTSRRRFVVPRALQRNQKDGSASDDDDNENGDDKTGKLPQKWQEGRSQKLNYNNFIENPADVRDRQAQRREATRNNRPQRDVQGQAKGKGQSHDVERNRLLKDKHKASRANHNRKTGADRKQAKGMF